MYRAIALKAVRQSVPLDDEAHLEELALGARVDFSSDQPPKVLLDGEDVSEAIRQPEISMAASTVSKVPAVRRVLVHLQQELGRRAGGVLEGRDIGTKVFPGTPYKFFLAAEPEVRAHRRYRELEEKGLFADIDSVRREMDARDLQDSTRAESPLICDETYTRIDTSALTVEEVVRTIVEKVRG